MICPISQHYSVSYCKLKMFRCLAIMNMIVSPLVVDLISSPLATNVIVIAGH